MSKSAQPEEKKRGPNDRAQELNALARQTPPPVDGLLEKEKNIRPANPQRVPKVRCSPHGSG